MRAAAAGSGLFAVSLVVAIPGQGSRLGMAYDVEREFHAHSVAFVEAALVVTTSANPALPDVRRGWSCGCGSTQVIG